MNERMILSKKGLTSGEKMLIKQIGFRASNRCNNNIGFHFFAFDEEKGGKDKKKH